MFGSLEQTMFTTSGDGANATTTLKAGMEGLVPSFIALCEKAKQQGQTIDAKYLQALAGKIEYEEKNKDAIIQLIKLAKDENATDVINIIMGQLNNAAGKADEAGKDGAKLVEAVFGSITQAVFTDDGSLVKDVNVYDVIALCAKQDNPGFTADQLRTLAVKLYSSGNGTCTLYPTVTPETINNFIKLLNKERENDSNLNTTVQTIAETLDKITNWPKGMTKPDLSKLKGGVKL